MTFTITYRAKDGALREEAVEAASRAECVAECRRRGIAPTKITEGGKGRDKRGTSRSAARVDARPPSQRRLTGKAAILAAVALVAVAGGVWWWIGGRGATALPAERPAKHKMEKPKAEKPAKPAAKPAAEPVKETNLPVKVEKPKKVPKPDFFSKPREEWTSREKALAMRYWIQNTNNVITGIDLRTRVPPPAYSNAVQELMAAYTIPGADCVPFGRITDAEARAMIETEITSGPDDPEELVEQKATVAAMIKELKEYMDGGGHAQTYFDKLEQRQQLETETMMTVRDEVSRLRREGDYEGAKAALDTYNEYLKSKGLPTIRMKTGPGRKKEEGQK